MKTISKCQDIYVLEPPIWFDQAGMRKGMRHDRQSLGIILAADMVLELRQIQGKKPLTLRLLNDDQKTEKIFSVSQEWISVCNTVTSVPFIDTPYGEDKIVVEFRYPTYCKILPIYKKYNSETDFFSLWDSNNAEFSLISANYFRLLIPACDKDKLRALDSFPNIDALITHYEKVFSFFNQLAGISFAPHRDTDKNILSKYFIKADKSGSGAAYYGGSWTAQSSSSVAQFWLNISDSSWGHLHEIAHGYQGDFMEDPTFSAGEVWNNIYAATYQDTYLGEKVFTEGWLYKNPEELFKKVIAYIDNHTEVNQWDLQSKLYFFMLMNDAAVGSAFTYFNQYYRQLASTPPFNAKNHRLLDLLSDNYVKRGQIDVTPFINKVGGCLTQKQALKNTFYRVPIAYPLSLLVCSTQLLDIQSQLAIKSPLSLVTPAQLAATELTGDIVIRLNIDHLQQIYGERVILMDGERYAHHIRINNPCLRLSNIPIGGYALSLPTGRSNKYAIEPHYALVKPGVNELNVDYQLKRNNQFVVQNFEFLGLGNAQFAMMDIDFAHQLLFIDVVREDPHSYFENREYARIMVKRSSGETVFCKSMEGTQVSLSSDQIAFGYGDRLEISHAEASDRLQLWTANHLITLKDKLNTFTLTAIGLQHQQIDPNENFRLMIEEAASEIRRHPEWIYRKFMPLKDDLYLAINNFSESEQEQLHTQYADILPIDNQIPGPYIGNKFIFEFQGLGNCTFFTTTIDVIQKKIGFQTNSEIPHAYFEDHSYAYISYQDAQGFELFSQDFIGNHVVEDSQRTFSLSYANGERIFIHHKEAHCDPGKDNGRLIFKNEMQDVKLLDHDKNNLYQLTNSGLMLLKSSDKDYFGYPVTDAVTGSALIQMMSSQVTEPEYVCAAENTITEPRNDLLVLEVADHRLA